MQRLAGNGSACTAGETIAFAVALKLIACFPPVRSRGSNGAREAFVKTFKRDAARDTPEEGAFARGIRCGRLDMAGPGCL